MATVEAGPGDVLHEVLTRAIEESVALERDVTFKFNEQEITVHPGDEVADTFKRVEEQVGYEILTRKEMGERAKESLERRQQEAESAMEEAGVPDEAALRQASVPWPRTQEELNEYVKSLLDRPHDYGTCVYAMSMAALATFRFASHKLGATGFQAGAAEMDFIKRARLMKDGFRLIDYGNMLFPQYWNDPVHEAAFREVLKDRDARDHIAGRAQELLDKDDPAAPAVVAHWRALAEGRDPLS